MAVVLSQITAKNHSVGLTKGNVDSRKGTSSVRKPGSHPYPLERLGEGKSRGALLAFRRSGSAGVRRTFTEELSAARGTHLVILRRSRRSSYPNLTFASSRLPAATSRKVATSLWPFTFDLCASHQQDLTWDPDGRNQNCENDRGEESRRGWRADDKRSTDKLAPVV